MIIFMVKIVSEVEKKKTVRVCNGISLISIDENTVTRESCTSCNTWKMKRVW